MLPASRAAMVPVFMATPTSAWARAGASLVPSPHMATSLPLACSSRISLSLASGVAWARKSSTPASAAMAAAVSALSPVIITVRMPIRRSSAKRSRMPPLTMSLRWTRPSTRPFSATASGVPPPLAMVSAPRCSSGGIRPPWLLTQSTTASTAPLRISRPSTSTPLIRVCAVNGTKRACIGAISRARSPYLSLTSTTIERPSGVSSGKLDELGRVGQFLVGDARHGDQLGGLAVAQRDGAGLVEQERVDVARGLDRAAGHGQHVEADQAVHAGDADGREQGADRGRDQGDEQRHQHDDRDRAAGIGGEARDADHRQDEDQRHAGEQDVERDLVGRLLPDGTLDQGDHPVDEGRALGGGDAHQDLVGEHARAAGDRRAVAAALADHRRRFAGDRRFVDRGHAVDDLAVGRDQVAGLDQDEIAGLEGQCRDLAPVAVLGRGHELGLGLGAGAPQRGGLRLAAALGHGLGQVGEQQRDPQPARRSGPRSRCRRRRWRGRARAGRWSAR